MQPAASRPLAPQALDLAHPAQIALSVTGSARLNSAHGKQDRAAQAEVRRGLSQDRVRAGPPARAGSSGRARTGRATSRAASAAPGSPGTGDPGQLAGAGLVPGGRNRRHGRRPSRTGAAGGGVGGGDVERACRSRR